MEDDKRYEGKELLDNKKLPEQIKNLYTSIYRSDQEKQLRNLEGYKHLAWTPKIRHLYYNKQDDILVKDLEGDIYIWKNPSKETIEEQVQQWPKAEVSVGEKYDTRFNRGEN